MHMVFSDIFHLVLLTNLVPLVQDSGEMQNTDLSYFYIHDSGIMEISLSEGVDNSLSYAKLLSLTLPSSLRGYEIKFAQTPSLLRNTLLKWVAALHQQGDTTILFLKTIKEVIYFFSYVNYCLVLIQPEVVSTKS